MHECGQNGINDGNDDQYPFLTIDSWILEAISPCLAERVFLIMPGMDPLRSASEMQVTWVVFSSIFWMIYPPTKTSPLTTDFTSGWGKLQAAVAMQKVSPSHSLAETLTKSLLSTGQIPLYCMQLTLNLFSTTWRALISRSMGLMILRDSSFSRKAITFSMLNFTLSMPLDAILPSISVLNMAQGLLPFSCHLLEALSSLSFLMAPWAI